MRSSRGMGAVRTSKMPKGSTITRKDNPDKVKMFAKGGKVKKMAAGGMQRNMIMPDVRKSSVMPMQDVGKSSVMQRNMPMQVMKKAKGGTVDPLKDKTGGKTDPEGGDYVIAGPAKGTKQKKPAPRPTTPSTPMPPKTGDKKDAEYGDYVIGKAKGGSANFIKGAIKKPGALRASLGAKPGKPIPAGKLDKASKAPGKLGQRARFAEMLRGFRKNKE